MQRDNLFCDDQPSTDIPQSLAETSPETADLDVRWLTLQLLELIGGNPHGARHLNARSILLGIESCTDAAAEETTVEGQVARGLYLMTYGLHRPALQQFERALDGHVVGNLAPIARLALEAHAFALLHIGCEEDARGEFERLITRQLEEGAEPAPEVVDHVTELVSVVKRVGSGG
jgi:hypothetical protein